MDRRMPRCLMSSVETTAESGATWAGHRLLQHCDRCGPETKSFEDSRNIDHVAEDGTLFDDGRHHNRIPGQERYVFEAAVGKECSLGKAAVLVADNRPIGSQNELAAPVSISVWPTRKVHNVLHALASLIDECVRVVNLSLRSAERRVGKE